MSPLQATRRIGTGDGWGVTETGIYVPDWADLDDLVRPAAALEHPEEQPTAIDLFAGAGGFSCGFHQAGFHVIGASEAWHIAAITYLLNLGSPDTLVHILDPIDGDKDLTRKCRALHEKHAGEAITASAFFAHHGKQLPDGAPMPSDAPGSGWISGQDGMLPCEHLWLGDVRGLTGERMLADVGRPKVNAVMGGPPCQGFSRAGRQEVEDPRNSLVFEFMRLVTEIKPDAFCMENVPGMLSMVTPEGIPVIDALSRVAEDGGFGTYDAIRKSLLSTSGMGAALKSKKAKASSKDAARKAGVPGSALEFDDEDVELELEPQGSLFEALT